jgi:hypothetical protein
VPILPIIDALILLAWTSLFGGFFLKAVWIATSYRPTFFGMRPSDFLFVAGVCLLFALALAARTWVKASEPELLARRRRARLSDAGYAIDDAPGFPRTHADEEATRRATG